MNPEAEAAAVIEELRGIATPERAEGSKAYLKIEIDHLGATVPQMRAAAKAVHTRNSSASREDVFQTIEHLWASGYFEGKAAAIELLWFYRKILEPDDIRITERLLRDSHTWALVDGLATGTVGYLVETHPQLTGVLDRWSEDPDFWIRRSSLLALLKPLRSGGGDFDRFARYADSMLEEKEFFIRKAIGWVLRDTGRKRPDMVAEWLLPRAHRASGLTVREALKPLSAADSEQILAAHRGTD